MTRHQSARRVRAGLLAGLLGWIAAARTAVATARDTVAAYGSGPLTLDQALGGLAAACGLAVLTWAALVTVCTAVAAGCAARGRLGGPASRVADGIAAGIAPASLRRLLALALGAALVSGALPARAGTAMPAPRLTVTAFESSPALDTSPASGPSLDPAWAPAPAGSGPGLARGGPATGDLDPGWSPSPSARGTPRAAPRTAPRTVPRTVPRAATTTGRDAPPAGWSPPGRRRPAAHEDRAVVVRRGDTLWDIAARRLGPGASDAEIATAWHRWYAANAAAIGPDPDLLLPGRRLTPPDITSGGA